MAQAAPADEEEEQQDPSCQGWGLRLSQPSSLEDVAARAVVSGSFSSGSESISSPLLDEGSGVGSSADSRRRWWRFPHRMSEAVPRCPVPRSRASLRVRILPRSPGSPRESLSPMRLPRRCLPPFPRYRSPQALPCCLPRSLQRVHVFFGEASSSSVPVPPSISSVVSASSTGDSPEVTTRVVHSPRFPLPNSRFARPRPPG